MADEVAPELGTTQVSEAGTSILTGLEAAGADAPEGSTEGTTEGSTEETKPTAEAEVKPEAVPEEYALTAPEGVTLDADVLASYTPAFKELGLTNESAQKLLNVHAEIAQKQLIAQHTDWVSTVKADPEIGGKNFATTAKDAQSAISRFGTPELKLALDRTGLGSHPELVRAFAKVGKAMGEAVIVPGTVVPDKQAPKTAAERLYAKPS